MIHGGVSLTNMTVLFHQGQGQLALVCQEQSLIMNGPSGLEG